MESLSELLLYDGQIRYYVIFWSLIIGLAVATVVGYVFKVAFGALIRKLLDAHADSPENAKTLSDLGMGKNPIVRIALKSSINFKNLLVAVTEDGKFYANATYYTEAPVFRRIEMKHRLTRIERIELKKKLAEQRKAAEAESETADSAETKDVKTVIAETKTEAENEVTSEAEALSEAEAEISPIGKPEKVNFNLRTAKYYIPDEHRDRAGSIFLHNPTKFALILVCIIVLFVIAYFSDAILKTIIRMFEDLFSSFSKKTI